MGFLSKFWRKIRPVRHIAEDAAEDYARRKVEKEVERAREKLERRTGTGDRRKSER